MRLSIVNKRVIALLTAFLLLCTCVSVTVSAKVDIWSLSQKQFYTTFAKALKEHDSELLGEFIGHTGDSSQFDVLEGVSISSYSVKLIDSIDDYGGDAAKITFEITKSDNDLFPVGNHDYYACFITGMFDYYTFVPYENRYDSLSASRRKLADSFAIISYDMNNFGSCSSKKLKNYDFSSAYLVHWVYEYMFRSKYGDSGISEKDLNKEMQKLFGSDNSLSQKTLGSLMNYRNGKYFNQCNHGADMMLKYDVKKVTKSKKTGLYTMEIWYYSDGAGIIPCRKIKYTYSYSKGYYTLKKINCYYKTGNDVYRG